MDSTSWGRSTGVSIREAQCVLSTSPDEEGREANIKYSVPQFTYLKWKDNDGKLPVW